MNILFFQYGDFGEAYRRLSQDGPETYRDQRASVDFVTSLRQKYSITTVAICTRPHDELLESNLRSIGIGENSAYRRAFVDSLITTIEPSLLICRTPNHHVIRWSKRHKIPTLLTFADLFTNLTLRSSIRNLSLRILLDRGVFPCVANHNLNASLSVSKALFYPKSRIIPWDWTKLRTSNSPKTAPADPGHPSAFFAGTLSVEKGVIDCLRAIALLEKRGVRLRFTFAGAGDTKVWLAEADALGLGQRVQFLGLISNEIVRQRMAESDIVVVPSRHSYAEGMPNVIYEAFASRTPLIASDHPAFVNQLRDTDNCLIFKAGDPSSLAGRIEDLLSNMSLFARLSAGSARAHESLYIGMEWRTLVSTFLNDPTNRTGWVEANSLARLNRQMASP